MGISRLWPRFWGDTHSEWQKLEFLKTLKRYQLSLDHSVSSRIYDESSAKIQETKTMNKAGKNTMSTRFSSIDTDSDAIA